MPKWQSLRMHLEFPKGKLVASANGKEGWGLKEAAVDSDLIKYLDSLTAQKNE